MSETIGLRLRTPKGDIVEARGAIGATLLRAAQAAGLPLEGTCEGQMACSTCHVVGDPEWFDRLEAASEEEEDMLDLAVGLTQTSRLGCQIIMPEGIAGLVVNLPAEHRNMFND